jgi:hypothetical protein
MGTDLAGVARATGIAQASLIRTNDEVRAFRGLMGSAKVPVFAQIKVDPEKLPLVLPPREASYLKNRFRISVLGEACLQD